LQVKSYAYMYVLYTHAHTHTPLKLRGHFKNLGDIKVYVV